LPVVRLGCPRRDGREMANARTREGQSPGLGRGAKRGNMETNVTSHSRRSSPAWSAIFWAARLLIFGLIGWLWFVSTDDSAWKTVSLAAVLALAALMGITWVLSRARAERRWRAALDAYAKQEQAKRTYSRWNVHA